MSQARDTSDVPRAIIHKRILEVATSRPRASMEAIAEDVPGASLDLVEKVLDRYGDPADSTGEPAEDEDTTPEELDTEGSDTMSDDEATTEPTESPEDEDPQPLTEKQRNALRFIRENPEASQSDLADEFDVTRATISRWVNTIPGFDWEDRHAFATDLLDRGEELPPSGNGSSAPTRNDDNESIDRLRGRLTAVERQLEEQGASPNGLDPELVHKVVHACMHSEHISEAEELELIKTLVTPPRRS